MKKTPAIRKSSTHFEQIPLEVAKKIANGEDSKKSKTAPGKARARRIRR